MSQSHFSFNEIPACGDHSIILFSFICYSDKFHKPSKHTHMHTHTLMLWRCPRQLSGRMPFPVEQLEVSVHKADDSLGQPATLYPSYEPNATATLSNPHPNTHMFTCWRGFFWVVSLLNNIPHASLCCMLKSIHTKVELRINHWGVMLTPVTMSRWLIFSNEFTGRKGNLPNGNTSLFVFQLFFSTSRAWLYLYMCHV